MSGDVGAFHAIDEMDTDLYISTNGDYDSGWENEFVEAEVANYIINLDEVKCICDPNNDKKILYDGSNNDARYYYSAEIDGIQVDYNFSFDSLKQLNPQAPSVTNSATGR